MKYKYCIYALIASLLSSFICAQVNTENKITFLSNSNNTSIFNSTPVASLIGVMFQFPTRGPVRSTPALVNNKLFFGSGDGYLYCINATSGKEIWKFNSSSPVHSSPEYFNGRVYFTNLEGNLFCLNGNDGKSAWKQFLGKDLSYKWGFDYYTSSPSVYKNNIIAGGGNGNLYLLNASTGKIEWTYKTGSRIKSKPLIINNTVYFGDFGGKLYSIDLQTRKVKWIFEAEGIKFNSDDYGFDRRAFVSSPTFSDGKIFIGNRDGFLYCINSADGKLVWKYDHKTSWVLSSPSVLNGKVFAGSSDKKFVNAVDVNTGKELWQAKSDGPVWSSISVTGNIVYGGDYGGNFFAIDSENGEYLWKFKAGDKIHSSSIVNNGVVYFGSDDGSLYALKGSAVKTGLRNKVKRAVYWEDIKNVTGPRIKVDEFVRDYFEKEGYAVIDGNGMKKFMEERANDKIQSVIVFAAGSVPGSIYNDSLSTDPVRNYLKTGGKIVLLGVNPFAYVYDKKTNEIIDLDMTLPNRLFGLNYEGKSSDAARGWNSVSYSVDGIIWGLQGQRLTLFQLPPSGKVKPLALDDSGYYAMWVKNFGGPEGSGLVQLWLHSAKAEYLNGIYNAAEYGMQ